MSLRLHVDTRRWREHQERVTAEYAGGSAGIVPVTKGNGYGFGNARLAAEAARLGADTLAVGTYDELPSVRDCFPGDLLVLSPWRPGLPVPEDPQVISTVSRLADLRELAAGDGRPRIVLEPLTSLRRHGMVAADLAEVGPLLDGVDLQGWALHLPLPAVMAPRAGGEEVARTVDRLAAQGLPVERVWVSHLPPDEIATLAPAGSALQLRSRVGTGLWLGDREAYRARAGVLDVHRVGRGDRVGYRQRRVRGDGHLVVVSGGTAHGIALEAPNHVATVRDRARALAAGGLEAAGRALSPYTIAGQRRWFLEPPHMQVSLLFLPSGVRPPAVGEELDVNVGMTLTRFDAIEFE